MEILMKYGDCTDTLPLRHEVFELEQGFTDDVDEIDKIAWHVAICENGDTIGCARLFCENDSDEYHAGRIAVKKSRRGDRLGVKIMDIIKDKAIEIGAKKLLLSSQMHAVGFYEKCGYERVGKIYLDQDSPHIDMVLSL